MIASLAELKAFLKITSTDEDSLLTDLLEASQAFIEKECNRTFEQSAITDKIDGDGDETLFLSNPPIASITSVSVDDVAQTASDYKFNENDGETWHKDENTFSKGRQNIVIVYSGGFATVPDDVKQAVIELASMMYKRNREAGVSSQSIGDFSVTFDSETMPQISSGVVKNYRLDNI